MGAKGIGTHDMGTLGIGATNLGSLSISRPGTDAPGMTPIPVHGAILHAPRLPGRHEKTRFLPLPKATRAHAAYPAGQIAGSATARPWRGWRRWRGRHPER